MSEQISPRDPAFAALLLDSHRRVVGTELCPAEWSDDAKAAAWLQDKAPFGLLAHDLSADPVFIYSNHVAQHCFGYTWEEFIGMPSRLSAAPDSQPERYSFVEPVSLNGFADGYRGRRVRKDGSHFWIENVTMWDLVDGDGTRHGQAAVFRGWAETTAQV